MSDNPTQDNRTVQLNSPLGKDKLLLSSFTMNEELSRPFELRIECLSKDPDIDFNKLLGLNAGITMITLSKKKRYFSGVVVEGGWFGERDAMFAYHLVLRPWFWLLTQTTDSRIFQNKSVTDIIKETFTKAGFQDFEDKTTENYKTIEYCVQYNETHFAFVSRLMETYGIYYYFKHTADKHILVLADGKGSHQPIPTLPVCEFAPLGERTRDKDEYVTTWMKERRFRTGKVVVNAFDFSKPTADLKTNKDAPGGHAHDKLEVYVYPNKYKKGDEQDLGQKYAAAVLHSARSEDGRRYATGAAPSLCPGGTVKLIKVKPESDNKEYLVVSTMHSFIAESYRTGSDDADGDSYDGSYVLQQTDIPYKAPLVTPRPVISGPQTAMVVGPKGEEIYTDEHGRVKLKFHWDRESKGDEKSSRWVRVAQIWSGKGWGGIVIPRIGMEAVVEFIEGDPDRPLVIGTVYNGDNTPPYQLPGNKTQAGVKTRSTTGGNDGKYSELVFEDKKDSELVRFHAEKDYEGTVEDKETNLVKGKNKDPIKEFARETMVEKGSDKFTVKTGDQDTKIGNCQKVDISVNQNVKVGKEIMIEAGEKITLKVMGSTITIEPASITINTPQLKTEGALANHDHGKIEMNAGLIKLN